MINIVLVGSGRLDTLKSMLLFCSGELSVFLKRFGLRIFDDSTFWKAENDPNYLKRNGRLSFNPSKRYLRKSYVGFSKSSDFGKVHYKLFFETPVPPKSADRRIQLTSENLLKVIQNDYAVQFTDLSEEIYDVYADCIYEEFKNDLSYFIVRFGVKIDSIIEDLDSVLKYYRELIL